MAGSTVNIDLRLRSTGIREANSDASKTADSLDRVTASATRASKALSASSRAASSTSSAANAPTSTSAVTEREYGKVRGAVGTGAAGRDFAKQAQGLGGLVALYATFAANIFAVGAAFEALNKAAQVERLVKATEMMSSQVGTNLNSISKNLVTASGHALSFAEAMQFTNIGTSAGLAGKQIESLTKIAKGAAIALGRDVGDSVRRIIQGTAKQEQEILDELGIFVKSKQAFDKYAQALGVKVDALTGTQRTQAYANEVERLGKKWEQFAEIDDPFSRFMATGKNALNDLLIGINKVFGPLVSFLAESESGIKALIVLISTTLTRRALPEVGSLFANLFTYDKKLAEAKASEAISQTRAINLAIVKDYEASVAKVAALNAKLKTLSVVPINDIAALNAIGVENMGNRTTKGIDTVGFKPASVATAFRDPKSYATQIAAEKTLLGVFEKQVKQAKDADFIAQGYIEKELVKRDLATGLYSLDKEGLAIAQRIYDKNVANNTALAQSVVLTKERNIVEEQLSAQRGPAAVAKAALEQTDPKFSNSKAATASAAATTAETAALTANTKAQQVNNAESAKAAITNTAQAVGSAESTATTVTETIATDKLAIAQAKLTAVREASVKGALAQNAAAASGVVAQFKAMVENIKGIIAAYRGKDVAEKASTASTGFLAKATNFAKLSMLSFSEILAKYPALASMAAAANLLLGASFKIIGSVAKFAIGAISALAMPVMLAWTAYELFGDTVKEWLGFDGKAQKALEEQKEKQKDYNESLGYAAAQMEMLNEVRAKGFESVEEEARYTDTLLKNLINVTEAYKTYIETVDKTAAVDRLKAAKENMGKGFSEAAYSAINLSHALSALGKEQMALNAAQMAGNLIAYNIALSKAKKGSEEYLNIEKERALQLQFLADLNVNASTVMGKEAASTNELSKAVQDLSKAQEDLAKKQAKTIDQTAKLNSAEAKKFYDDWLILVAEGGNASLKLKEVEDSLITSMSMGGEALAKALPLWIAYVEVKAALANAENTIDPKVQAESLLKWLNAQKGAIANMATAYNGTVKGAKASKEYTDVAKRGFLELQGQIDGYTLSLKAADAQASNRKAIEDRIAALRGMGSEAANAAEYNEAISKSNMEFTKAQTEAELTLNKVLKSSTRGKNIEDVELAKAAYVQTMLTLGMTKIQAEKEAELAFDKAKTNQIAQEYTKHLEEASRQQDTLKQLAEQQLTAEGYLLEARTASGLYTQQEIADQQNLLDIKNQQVTAQNSLDSLQSGVQKELAKPISELQSTTPGVKDTAISEILKINAEYERKLGLQESSNALTMANLLAQGLIKSELAQTNDEMAKMESITASLTGLFGEMGTNIGGAMTALAKMAKDEEKYAEDKLQAQLEYASVAGTKDEEKAVEKLAKLEEKHTKDELDNISDVASKSKKMFSEKTAAYKILDTVEKVSHGIKLALEMKTMAVKTANFLKEIFFTETKTAADVAGTATKTAAELAGEALTLPAKITGAIASLFSSSGVLAFALVGAMLAMIGSGGGGSSMSPVGLTAEDMQKSQGTGQSWVDGELVENGGGVFGDIEAKTKSIANSLELILETDVKGLSFTSSQLPYLEKMNKGIEKIALGVYGITGVTSGSAGGTIEGTSSSGGGLFGMIFGSSSSSTSIINSGIYLKGTFMELAQAGKGVVKTFETVQTTTTDSGFLGFGGGTSTSINTNYYDNIPQIVKEDLASVFSNAVDLFKVQAEVTKQLPADAVEIMLANLPVTQTASLRGLTGTALQEEIMSVISTAMDQAAAELFPQMKKFRQFGEGYSETVTRVIDGFEKVNLGLESMGLAVIDLAEVPSRATVEIIQAKEDAFAALEEAKASEKGRISELAESYGIDRGDNADFDFIQKADNLRKATKAIATEIKPLQDAYDTAAKVYEEANTGMTTNSYEASEALINLMGGLENFIDATDEFTSRFLTDAENMAFISENVTKRMTELGSSILEITPAHTLTSYQYSEEAPTTKVPGQSDNALWEDILGTSWNAHVARFGVGLDPNRKDQDYLNHMQRLLDDYKALNVATLTEVAEVSTETNQYAMDMFKTFSDGNDGIIDTKDEFKNLVQAIENETSPAAQQLFKDLMGIQSAFADVAEAVEEANSAIEDLKNEAKDLEIELMRAMGSIAEANAAQRALDTKDYGPEALAWYDYNTAMQAHIDVINDMKQAEEALASARTSMENQIYSALGNSDQARQVQLELLDESLRPSQLYLYALEDEATLKTKLKAAQEKENSAIKTTISNLTNFISTIGNLANTLRDAANALLVGDATYLTPAQRYEEAKRQAMEVAAIATGIASTDAEIAARNDAVSKLPSVTSTFLSASRDLYASSEQYTQDFNSVLQILNNTASSLDAQKTDSEMQLEVLNKSSLTLEAIEESTDTVASLMAQLVDATAATEAARVAAAASGSVAAGGVAIPSTPSYPTAPAIPDATSIEASAKEIIGGYYKEYLSRDAEEEGLAFWLNQYTSGNKSMNTIRSEISNSPEARVQILYDKLAGRVGEPKGVGDWIQALQNGYSKEEIVLSFAYNSVYREPKATDLAKNINSGKALPIVPGFAKGGLAEGMAVVGELGPELVDFKTPTRVYSNKASNDLLSNKELIQEIRELRSEVSKLRSEQKEQTGHLISTNYSANAQNAKAVAEATEKAARENAWAQRAQLKLA